MCQGSLVNCHVHGGILDSCVQETVGLILVHLL
jgi:hypothetical protein